MTITLTREEAQSVLDALGSCEEDWLYNGEYEYCVDSYDHALVSKAFELLRTRLAQPEPEPEPVAWQPIDTAPKGKIVLVHYKNRLGNGRTMRAQYYLSETLESDESESGWADEGWYEESEAYEYLMPLEGEPTHWMPLPPAPDAAPPQREWQGLTDEEIEQGNKESWVTKQAWESAVWWAEEKLKEKNT